MFYNYYIAIFFCAKMRVISRSTETFFERISAENVARVNPDR